MPCPFDEDANRLLRPFAKVMLGKQRIGSTTAFGEGQAPQCAHECDGFARVHRGIETAFLGEVADLRRGLERALARRAPAACRSTDR